MREVSFVHFIIEVKEDVEANLGKNDMCRFRKNVMVWKMFFRSCNDGMLALYKMGRERCWCPQNGFKPLYWYLW
jgi:hypothetical protein